MNIYEEFIKESNHIEGEDNLPIDVESLKKFLANDLTEENLHEYHLIVSGKQSRSGKRRDCNVWIGGHVTPPPSTIPWYMKKYFKQLPKLSAFEAHNKFEAIHPYMDFNGRMGRAIRLHKMQNVYDWKISFLHNYYYQTLSHLS